MEQKYQSYDSHLKSLFFFKPNQKIKTSHDIPRSTIQSWSKKEPQFISLNSRNIKLEEALLKLGNIENENLLLKLKIKLLDEIMKIFQWKVEWNRLPESENKKRVLKIIESCSENLSKKKLLEFIGLSSSRFYSWKVKEKSCDLDDYSSCPKKTPNQITNTEIMKIKEYVQSEELSHIPLKSLVLLAKRKGEVFCSEGTWRKIIKKFNLSRVKKRLYPEKPKVGIRADCPNQIWHIDISVIKLIDGTKAFIQAVIDNFSRYVLAWKVLPSLSGLGTKEILQKALKKVKGPKIPTVMADNGIENINSEVNSLIEEEIIDRKIAQIEISFSNSIVEALFRSLKNNFLYQKSLDNFDVLKSYVDFYLNEHNKIIPHSAFNGATPFEKYKGKWTQKNEETLKKKVIRNIRSRIKHNQNVNCGICTSS